MTNWFRRVWYLLNRRRHERELVAEMHEHRDLMHDPAKFGDTHRFVEQSRDAWGWNWLDDATQDLKLGVRGLMRAPAFAVTAVLILTFGIGLNLTLYQMANVGLLRPPDIKSPETLARFKRRSPGTRISGVSYPLAQLVASGNTVLSAVLLEENSAVAWGRELWSVTASFVSPNWFSELGGTPAQGRLFAQGVDTATSEPVAVITHQFWRTRLGSDPNVIGSTVEVNRIPVTVIGITAREFVGTDNDQPSVYLVIDQREHVLPDSAFLRSWETETTYLYGRLKDGVSAESARESLRALMTALREQQPDHIAEGEWLDPALGTANFRDQDEQIGIVAAMSLLGLLTTMVLVVAATNVGNLVLSRATGRSRELGVRIALGAKRSRIVRQLVIETLPLAIVGAAGGVTLAGWTAGTIAAVAGTPDNVNFAPDWRTIVVSLFLSVITLLVIGALPAWKVARQELMAAIKDGGQQVSLNLDKARLRRMMMAAQVGGSCLILVLAAMMTRTLQRVLSDDLGFEYEQSAVLEPGLGRHGFDSAAAMAYWNTVKARIEQHPETAALSLALAPPLGRRVRANTYDDAPGLDVVSNSVEPAFFEVMEIPLVLGRTFQAGDDPRTTVILSRAFAMAMYGSLDVVGRGFPRSTPEATIVGVARDAHSIKVEAVHTAELYRPLAAAEYVQAVLIARARGDAATLAPVLREAASADPRILPGVGLLRVSFERRVFATRMASGVAAGTGVLTLIIACLGIFGVVSYGATLRVKEFGIHLALGAESGSIVRLVVRNILWPVAIGMTLGVAAAGPIGVALSGGSPIQVEAADPAAYAGALVMFVVAALAAAMLPAIRVLKSDPIQSLRHS
jgi:predicted permease